MIGIANTIFRNIKKISGGASTDPDAQAFITAAGITDATQKSAVNQLVLDLKSANIWTKMKAVYPVVGGTASTHKWNLKNPLDTDAAFRLTFSTGWTHGSTGMTPNGAAYADTFFIPSIDTDGTSHYSFYSRTDVAASSNVFGSNASGPNYFYTILNPRNTSNQCVSAINENTGELFANTSSLGLFILNRQASSDYDVWINSTKKINTTKLSLGRSSFKIYLGALNQAGTAGNYSTNQCAFFSAGLPLTDTEATLLYQITEKYQVALGRNVNTTQNFYYNGAYDNDTNVYLFRTQITDNTQQTAVNTLVTDLKTYNIWSKMKALYPVLGGTASTHAVNLTGNTAFNLSFSTGWTHSSNGMLPTSAYADTFLIPSTSLTLYNTHLSFYSRSNTPLNSDSDIGAMYFTPTFSYTAYMTLKRSLDNNAIGYLTNNDTNRVSYSPSTAAYFSTLSRTANNSLKIYNNGVLKATNSVVPVAFNQGLPLNKILISALNYYDGTTNSILAYSSKQCAFASIGDGLTDTEVANLYTAVQNYNTTLNRQV